MSTSSIASTAARPDLLASWRDPARQLLTADILVVLLAASLPWSTSATAIFVVLWLIAVIPVLDWPAFARSLKRPVAVLPLAFFALAVFGVLWSEGPWPERLHGINPVAKLLVIPFLLYYFERSQRGAWVLTAFLVSCSLLMALSWIIFLAPELKFATTANAGVPVKNYIDQSQEFAFCLFALAGFIVGWLKERRFLWLTTGIALIVAFLTNMMFVVSARTALICIPPLLIVFAIVHLSARATAMVLTGALIVAGVFWSSSPYLRYRVGHIAIEYKIYRDANAQSSTGERLEFWRKSIKFVFASPLIGNGTGSTKQLFAYDAVGQRGISAEIVSNPHNQTLNVAVQWGLLGVVILYAMWLFHLLLFRGTGIEAWIGMLVVLQNFLSSLFNSHLFDFHEGWMYVLGVGVAGGVMLRNRRECVVVTEKDVLSGGMMELSGVERQ